MTKILQDMRPLRHFDQRELIIAAFRYYLGRMTISTTFFAQALAKAWMELEEGTRDIIARELEEAFKEDDKRRASLKPSTWLPLGHDCDRAAWEEVRQQYTPRFKKRDTCTWAYHDSHNQWDTECGHTIDEDDLGCDEVKVCPFCKKETTL